ncbi:Uncharacterised protein [uncultured archaeon]|nr:Uncharacterised protein [uncultured archaeon]
MVDYVSAIKKPFQDIQTLAIGTVLGMIPFVSLLISGYALGVGRKVVNGDASLPKFSAGEIVPYIKDTVFALIISLVYELPGIVLLFIGIMAAAGTILAGIASGDTAALASAIMAGIAAGGIFFLLGMVLVLVGGLLATMGVFYYLQSGSLMAGFNIGGALKKVLTVPFWVTIIVYFVMALAYMALFAVLSIIPIIGSLIGGGLMVYGLSVTGYTILGQVFKETQ